MIPSGVAGLQREGRFDTGAGHAPNGGDRPHATRRRTTPPGAAGHPAAGPGRDTGPPNERTAPVNPEQAQPQPDTQDSEQEYGVWLYVFSTPTADGMGDWTTGNIDEIGEIALERRMDDIELDRLITCVRLIQDETDIWVQPLTIKFYEPISNGEQVLEIEIMAEDVDGGGGHYDYWISDERTGGEPQAQPAAPTSAPGGFAPPAPAGGQQP